MAKRKSSKKTTAPKARSKNQMGTVTVSRSIRQNLQIDDLKKLHTFLGQRINSAPQSRFVAPAGTIQIDEVDVDEALVRIEDIVRSQIHQRIYFYWEKNSQPNHYYPSHPLKKLPD